MPRYAYRCAECATESTIFHLVAELPGPCPDCGAPTSLKRLLTQFSTVIKGDERKKVGDATEEFIESARKELQQQRKELNKNR